LNRTQYSENFVIGDARADAPELAKRGPYGVGVRTLQVVNPDQLDILKYSASNPTPRYDRPLTLEVWYPAIIPAGVQPIAWYTDVLGNGPNNPDRPNTPFEFAGCALRDAAPNPQDAPYPLVIVSHGYPGSRVLMLWLTENLASKGYLVVALDHTESTHGDSAGFASTLLNRPLDDLFVLNTLAKMNVGNPPTFLAGMVDVNKTAVVGYSMGAYGALNVAGVGVNQATVSTAVPGGKLAIRQTGNPAYAASIDPRIKAIVALAPWGGPVFDAEGLKGLKVPALFIVGSADTVAGYANVRRFFEQAIHSDRYLLVFQNGTHNIAVNPTPLIATTRLPDYQHYQEPVWDNTRCNNLNQHIITAFLGVQLKGLAYQSYLAVTSPALGLELSHRASQ
jgi:predicted dienelactone hydrolase